MPADDELYEVNVDDDIDVHEYDFEWRSLKKFRR